MQNIRLVNGIYITTTQKLWWRNAASGGWTATTLSSFFSGRAVVLYCTGHDQTFDLVGVLADILTAATAKGNFNMNPSNASAHYGKGSLTKQAGTTDFQISARNPAGGTVDNSDNIWKVFFPELAEAGTWSKAINGGSGVAVTEYSTRQHGGGFYPERLLGNDITEQNYVAAQSVANGGAVRTVFFCATATYVVELWLTGLPWALAFGEFQALQDFLDHAAENGTPTYISYDTDPTGDGDQAYDRLLYPFGYVFGQLLIDTLDWLPEPQAANYYKNWKKELRFRAIPRVVNP